MIGRLLSHLAMKELTNRRKAAEFGKGLSSKLSMSCERKSGFHLVERTVVAAV